jgi:hypothetical protein
MLNFSDEDKGMSKEAKAIYDSKLLYELRDHISDIYWQIFEPEPDRFTQVDNSVERLMSYLSHAISIHLNDFDGWEETEDTIKEFNNIFFYRKKKDNGQAQLSEHVQKTREEDDNIPF